MGPRRVFLKWPPPGEFDQHTLRTHLLTTTNSARLLQLAVPLVRTHGFTRTALARAVLDLPQPHAEPLPDAAVTALFGQGDDARRTLVRAWLDDARCQMRREESPVSTSTMRDVLYARMRTNEPVLRHLPEVRRTFFLVSHARLTFLPRHSHCSRRLRVFCPLTRSPSSSTPRVSRTKRAGSLNRMPKR